MVLVLAEWQNGNFKNKWRLNICCCGILKASYLIMPQKWSSTEWLRERNDIPAVLIFHNTLMIVNVTIRSKPSGAILKSILELLPLLKDERECPMVGKLELFEVYSCACRYARWHTMFGTFLYMDSGIRIREAVCEVSIQTWVCEWQI